VTLYGSAGRANKVALPVLIFLALLNAVHATGIARAVKVHDVARDLPVNYSSCRAGERPLKGAVWLLGLYIDLPRQSPLTLGMQ
jgi:hypothetical protein